MKNLMKPVGDLYPHIKKLTLIMRLSVLLILIAVFSSTASVYSQAKKLTLKMENARLSEVFDAIEDQSEFYFFYNRDYFNDERIVSVDFENKLIDEILKELFKNEAVKYEIYDRNILLTIPEASLTTARREVMQQQRSVSGKVTDSGGQPLPGATVVVKGTTQGTVTDVDGNYSLTNIPEDATLVFSFVGMRTQEVAVGDQTTINVRMEQETIGLEEVVAVGYGVQKKENLVGSVTSVDGEQIESVRGTDVTNAISGQLPGAIVIQQSGEPGNNAAKILVRGRSTLGDNTDPLVVIDGIPDRSLNEIDPNDIESISLLKDASAAIYGTQAANGVILVTTKRGTSEKASLSYNFYQSFLTPTILPETASAAEYAQYISDYQDYEGQSRLYSDRDIELFKSGEDPWEHPQTNWMNDLVSDWTTSSRHNLSLNGGNEKMRYYVSFGYRNEEAFYEQESTNYNQYNLRINLDIPVTDWLETSVNYGGFLTQRKYPTTGTYYLIGWSTLVVPTQPSFWPTGEPGPDFEGGVNPVVNTSFDAGYDQRKNYKNQLTFKASVKPPFIDGLSVDAFYTYDINNQRRKIFKKPWTLYYPLWDTAERNSDGFITNMELEPRLRGLDSPELTESFYRNTKRMMNFSFNYSKDFDNHSFSVFGSFEQVDIDWEEFDAYRKYFISDVVQTLNAGGEADKDNSGYMDIYARQSLIGRINYNYKQKYLAEFIYRRDGSLKFPPSSRWGNFPGFLLGWRASEEDFWNENLPFINYFKLRASYGKMGMDPGAAFQYLNKYSLGSGVTIGTDKVVKTKISQDGVANPNITWEKQTTYNIGFDSQLLDNTFHLNTEFFYNKRSDILTPRNASVPDFTGLSLPDENIGIVNNRGFEIEAGYHKNFNTDFRFDITGNLSWNHNEIEFMDEPEKVVPWQALTGKPYGAHLVYNAIGIFKTEEDLSYPHWDGAKPGDVIFEDVSGDGEITSDDRILLEKTDAPELFYGIKFDLSYKRWDLSLLFQGQGTYYRAPISGNRGIGQNVYKWMATDYWTPENNNSDNARPFHRADQYWSYLSNANTYWYDNMAYCRLKNAVLNYSVPSHVINQLGLSNADVFVSGNNLFLLYSKHNKYDPEVGDPESYPAMRTISMGVKVIF